MILRLDKMTEQCVVAVSYSHGYRGGMSAHPPRQVIMR